MQTIRFRFSFCLVRVILGIENRSWYCGTDDIFKWKTGRSNCLF